MILGKRYYINSCLFAITGMVWICIAFMSPIVEYIQTDPPEWAHEGDHQISISYQEETSLEELRERIRLIEEKVKSSGREISGVAKVNIAFVTKKRNQHTQNEVGSPVPEQPKFENGRPINP